MSEDKNKEEGVEIDETEVAEVTEEVEEKFSVEGLLDEEVAAAKELGLVKDSVEEEEDADDDNEEVEEKEEAEEEDNTDPDNFEDMDKVIEKDEKSFHQKFSPNQKALYFKAKAAKKKLQESNARAEELQKKVDELKVSSGSSSKLEKIAAALKRGDATYEEFESIINEEVEASDKDVEKQPETVQDKINTKLDFTMKIGSAKYDNFAEVSKLAEELALQDRKYKALIVDDVNNDEVDESQLAETIVMVAKFHPKYNEVVNKPQDGEGVETVKTPKVKRALENAKKKVSSASVGGSGRRIISEAELTVEQAERLSPDKWNKLKPETQKRILMGINP